MIERKEITALVPCIVVVVLISGDFFGEIVAIQSGNVLYGIMGLFFPPLLGVIFSLTFLRIYKKVSHHRTKKS